MILRISRPAGQVAALVVLLGVLGCGTSDQTAPPNRSPDDRLTVVASTDVWASVVRAVAGNAVDIRTIIDDPAGDPHSYESSPADAAAVARADLVVFNGGGYDEFIEQFREQTPDQPAVEAFALAGRPLNEHVWYDLPVVRQVAGQVAEQLGRLAPGQAQQFTAGAEAFGAGIDELRAEVAAIAQAHADAPVAMTEPVAYHLVEAAGLQDRTPPEFTEAVEEETDPPAAAVAATTDLLTQRQVRILIHNPQTETPVTSQVRTDAETAGIPVVPMTETLPDAQGYLGWMSGQIDALAGALR